MNELDRIVIFSVTLLLLGLFYAGLKRMSKKC